MEKKSEIQSRLSRKHWLHLFKKPPVWYRFEIILNYLTVESFWVFSLHSVGRFLSQGHGVRSHVHLQHVLHAAVMAADVLQGIVSSRNRNSSTTPLKASDGSLLLINFSICWCVLQPWVYNVVPWLTAIPSGLGAGFVSDFLIAKGTKAKCVVNPKGVSLLRKSNLQVFVFFFCRIQSCICEKNNASKCRNYCNVFMFY